MNSSEARKRFTEWMNDPAAADAITKEGSIDASWIGFWEGWKAALAAAPTPPAHETHEHDFPTNERLELLWEDHGGHPADFAADVLERWGGWERGILGYGGSASVQIPPDHIVDATKMVPAQEDQWQQAVLNECMAIECCYTESDPAGTVKRLIDWHVENERSSQEDEPFGHVSIELLKDEWKAGVVCKDRGCQVGEEIPLYTRPDNSGLRKAAEEAKRVLAGFIDEYGGDEVDHAVLENLRAALEGK